LHYIIAKSTMMLIVSNLRSD